MDAWLLFVIYHFGGKALDAIGNWTTPKFVSLLRRGKLSSKSQEIARSFDDFSYPRIKPSEYSIKKIGKITRPEIQEIRRTWSGGINGVLLVGTAGSGKSGIAHQLGRVLLHEGNSVLFLDATEVPSNANVVDYIDRLLSTSTHLVEAFAALGKEQVGYFIIDQMDSIYDPSTLGSITSLVKSLVSTQGVRVLAVSRTYEAEEESHLKELDLTRVYSKEISKDDADTYLGVLGLRDPSQLLLELAQNLLNLSLIAEISIARGNFIWITSETQLWERYTDTIIEREGEEVLDRGFHLACSNLREEGEEFSARLFPDHATRRLISRGVLIYSSFLRLRFRHESLQEFLCAYKNLPERTPASTIYRDYGYLRGSRIVKWLHSLLHLHDKSCEALFVDELLSKSAEEIPFYFRSVVIVNLREQENPSKEVSEVLSTHLAEDSYKQYFFSELENPSWLIPLYENGVILDVPDPLEDPENPGYYSMPRWHAGEYLKKMATHFPMVVRNVALNFKTDNSRAFRTLLEALLMIPPEIAAETVEAFKAWSETPFVRFMNISHELGIIMEYLTRGEQIEAGLQVLEVLAEPFGVPDHYYKDKTVAASRFEFFWVEKAFKENLPVMINADPLGTLEVLKIQLIKGIELEHDPQSIELEHRLESYWRLNITPEGELNYSRDFKNLLVNVIILALEEACEKNVEGTADIIDEYINSEYTIFRRIGVVTLRQWGHQYPGLLEEAYRRHVNEPIRSGQSEFRRLIEAQYGHFPEDIQNEIMDGIDYGPDPERVDELLDNYPDHFSGNTRDEKKVDLVERWKLKELDGLAPWIEGEHKEKYESLLVKHGKPEPPHGGAKVTSWIGPESPIETDELSGMNIEDVIQYLVDYEPPEQDSIRGPSREGLGRTFEEDVKARATDYIENADLLIRDDLHYVFHTHYFRVLEIALKNREISNIDNIIPVCDFIASRENNHFPTQEFGPDLSTAKLAVANVLEQGLSVRDPILEFDDLEKVGEIIVKLISQVEFGSVEDPESTYDPATHSLNEYRGKAVHTLINFGLHWERKRKQDQVEESPPVMHPLVKETLSRFVDSKQSPSLSIHSVYGWRLPQLFYLDKGWAVENLEKILPLDSDMTPYWLAAWSAYLRFSDVYTDIFPVLIPHYKKAVERLNGLDDEQSSDRVEQKLISHLLKAYLLGMIGLDSADNLILELYKRANPETRSHGGFWLSQALNSQMPSSQDDVWTKIWGLWQWRLREATAGKKPSVYSKEIANYCRLLKNTPLGLDEMYKVILKTLEFKAEGFEVHQIIEFLSDECDQFPALAISLLIKIVSSRRRFHMTTDTQGNVEKILRAATDGDDETREKGIEIINILGERGDYRWRPLLDEYK